jgi:hypothetical protein
MPPSPAPIELDQALDPDWLSFALSHGREPVKVNRVNVVETLGPSALKVRMVLDYAEAPANLPSELCMKGVFDPKLTAWLKNGAQRAEAYFYERCAPKLTVRVPRSYYAGYDPENMNGIVLMEDLIPRGVRFLTALSPYSQTQARSSLDQLARLHGPTWNANPALEPTIVSNLDFLAKGPSVSADRMTELLHGERGAALPEAVRSGARIYAGTAALARRDPGTDRCFVHGDAHAGNVWEGPDGIGLVDWQVLQRCNWSIDIAYHISAALDVEERRRAERDLLRYYLDRVAAHGGTPPNEETAWRLYRESLVYGFLMWAMTLRVEPEIVNQFVTRTGLAVADHDSFNLLSV